MVNTWLPCRFVKEGGETVSLVPENGTPPDGEADWLPFHDKGETGDIGDKPHVLGARIRFPIEDESRSIGSNDWASGLKACASGLKPLLVACTSRSSLSIFSSLFL